MAEPKNSIACDACNCTYNSKCHCTASGIKVGGKTACRCDETCCDTFKDKNT